MGTIDWLTYEHFARREGEPFSLLLGDEIITTELIAASESTEAGGPGPQGQQRRQFSLVFRGPVAPMLPQGTYRIDHTELGELELFLVPVGARDDGVLYEAAFA